MGNGNLTDVYLLIKGGKENIALYVVMDQFGQTSFSETPKPFVSSWIVNTFEWTPFFSIQVPADCAPGVYKVMLQVVKKGEVLDYNNLNRTSFVCVMISDASGE